MKVFPILLCLLFPILAQAGPTRTWTSSSGSSLEAELIDKRDNSLRLKRTDNGQTLVVPLPSLSKEDQDWFATYEASLQKDAARMAGAKEGPYADSIQGEWVKFPKEKLGLVFQFYADRAVTRGKDQLYPLFLHMHGAGARADDVEVGKVEIAAQELVKTHYDDNPCFICVPLCPPDVFWGQQTDKLEAIIDDLVANLPIDRDRIYLSGYSMGAGGVTSLISSRPDQYAAAFFADGNPKPDWPGTVKTSLLFYYSNERDSSKIAGFAEQFKAEGGEIQFTILDDTDHNGIHWKVAKEPKNYEWLFSQSRKSE